MREMQEKLERMSREAERARPTLPPDLAAAFGRIEEGMSDLVSRIAASKSEETAPADRFVFAPKSDDAVSFVFDQPAHANAARNERVRGPAPEGGWDREAAEALMQLYESGDTGLSTEALSLAAPVEGGFYSAPVMRTPAQRAPVVVAGLGEDRGWLEERFGHLTDKFTQSLASARPDAALDRMMERIDTLEQRFDTAISNVAKGVDKSASAASIKQIEAQIADIGRQMGTVTQQLTRLGAIEQNLSDLTAFAAAAQEAPAPGDAIASQPAFDMEALADVVATRAADRLSHLAATAPAVSPEIANAQVAAQKMLQEFMHERRRSDEQTNGMLDTMQEALVRLIDRVEAIDAATTNARTSSQPAHAGHFVPAADERFAEPESAPSPQTAAHRAPARPARQMADARTRGIDRETEPDHSGLGDRVEIIDADSLAAPVEEQAPPQTASNNPRGRVRASVNANIPEPEVEAEPAAAPVKKRGAPRAKTPASGTVGKRGMMIAAIALALVGVSYATSLLLSDRYGGRMPGVTSPAVAPAAQSEIGTKTSPASSTASSPARQPNLVAPPAVEPQRKGAIVQPPEPASTRPASAPAAAPAAAAPERASQNPSSFPAHSIPETVTDDLSQLEDGAADQPATAVPSLPAPRLASNSSPVTSASSIPGISLDRSQPALRPHEFGMVAANVINAEPSARPLAAARAAAPQPLPAPPAPVAAQRPAASNAAGIVTGTTNRATVTSFGAPPAAPKAPANTALTEGVQQSSELPPAGVGPMSLRISAAQGDPSAAFEVGSRLAEGRGVRQDFNTAFTWYQRSASKGFALAQYRLGTLYERGLGTAADLGHARAWYQRSAEQGNVKAMHNLAVLAAGRDGTPPNHAEAAKWFAAAADRGLADSQFNLGVLYDNGLGVAKDQRAAYKWFSLAARGGDKEAARRRDALLATMDVTTLRTVDSEIDAWRSRATDRNANEPRVAGDLWRNRRPSEPPQQMAPNAGQQPPGPPQQQQAADQGQQAAPAAVRRFAPQPVR